ncbi:hypothetical protein B5V89_15325 [Heyndrickxia sporothermodurans]|uniref:LiaG family protein n=1 Tax=Heyndrickxia TaxID=2837504 RepID=UPI000D3BF150|nr:DUF4097 domain-containing protein [Heyndrickxia sporothermodurans]PTY77173.1 hypothetical protein B5V89_15325 [Heyndrickxia sporothermodurans]
MKKLLLFLLVLVGLYFIGSSIKEASWFPFSKGDAHTQSIKHIDLLDLKVDSSNTVIIPEDREDVKAELEGKGKLDVDRSGDTIRIEVKRKWFQHFGFWNKSKLTVHVPREYNRDLNVTIGSGKLTMEGPSKKDPMKLKNMNVNMGSGQLDLENLDVKQYKHNGSSGMANLSSISTQTGEIRMSSGIVNVDGYEGELDATLSSGKLNVQMDKLEDSINVHVSSGLATLDLPDNADFTLKGKVSSGDISCDFPLESQEVGNHKVNGKHGSGKHTIDVTVSSGKVNIY